MDSRFNKDEAILANGAAFDLVRASVNLVLAGLLIALGTSLKLPLSTTYVAFMVAMGSSLADRACIYHLLFCNYDHVFWWHDGHGYYDRGGGFYLDPQ